MNEYGIRRGVGNERLGVKELRGTVKEGGFVLN